MSPGRDASLLCTTSFAFLRGPRRFSTAPKQLQAVVAVVGVIPLVAAVRPPCDLPSPLCVLDGARLSV
jgi:hypothetical protein